MIIWVFMLFSQIVGQESVKNHLRKIAGDGKIPHAMLFTGQVGVGKLQLAVAFAQYLACKNHTADDSCGKCASCMQWGRLQHPDLHFAYPVIKKGGETPVADDYAKEWREQLLTSPYFDLDDWYERIGAEGKQGMIYEKESSEIIRKLSLKSYSGGAKVMIIWQPEKMNATCANKLLKIIEEPPAETIFMLVSENPQLLLPTILSRVQTIPVERLPEQTISLALAERFPDRPTTEILDMARLANGSFLRALKNMQTDELRDEMLVWWKLIMRKAWLVGRKKDYNALLFLKKWSTEQSYEDEEDNNVDDSGSRPRRRTVIAAGREVQKAFLDYAVQQVRENFIRNFSMPDISYQTRDEAAFSDRFAPFINQTNVEQLVELFTTARKQIEQNGNAKMIFFDVCLQLIVLIK